MILIGKIWENKMSLSLVTVNVKLDGFYQAAQKLLDSAINGGNALLAEAASKATTLVSNATVLLDGVLTKQVSTIDATAQNFLSTLGATISDLENGVYNNLSTSLAKLQLMANALPLANDYPQVMNWTAYVVLADNIPTIRLIFEGSFPKAAASPPKLTIGKQTGTLCSIKTTQLTFEVAISAFAKANSAAIAYSQGHLVFPATGFIIGNKQFTFPVCVGALPSIAGKISIQWDKVPKAVTQRAGSSPEHHQYASNRERKPTSSQVYAVQPAPGWTIIPATAHLQTLDRTRHRQCGKRMETQNTPRGRWAHSPITVSPTFVQFQVTTYQEKGGTSGDVTFAIRFQESSEVPAVTGQEDVNLHWGEGVVKRLPANSQPQITFTAFNGTTPKLLLPAAIAHSFVVVRRTGDDVAIQVKNPADITLIS